MEACFTFQWRGGGRGARGGFVFQMEGALFLRGPPHRGASVLMRGVFKKICRMGESTPPPHPPRPLTMGNPGGGRMMM